MLLVNLETNPPVATLVASSGVTSAARALECLEPTFMTWCKANQPKKSMKVTFWLIGLIVWKYKIFVSFLHITCFVGLSYYLHITCFVWQSYYPFMLEKYSVDFEYSIVKLFLFSKETCS